MEFFFPEALQVIEVECEYYGVSRAELMKSRRRVSNMERDLAIYLVRKLCRMTLPEVGKFFGMPNYSSISSVVQRVKKELESVRKPGQKLKRIKAKVSKSQKRTCPPALLNY